MSTHNTELTNLLPQSAIRALRRQYFVRLSVVVLGMTCLALIIHGVLLIPAYLYAHAEVAREQKELDAISSSTSSAEEKSIRTRIASVQNDIGYLGRLETRPTASGAIRAVLAVPHPGVGISGFTVSVSDRASSTVAQMTVTGTANTRDSLRQYALSLGQLSYVSKADLPISAYAKETAIPFTITLTGTLRP